MPTIQARIAAAADARNAMGYDLSGIAAAAVDAMNVTVGGSRIFAAFFKGV